MLPSTIQDLLAISQNIPVVQEIQPNVDFHIHLIYTGWFIGLSETIVLDAVSYILIAFLLFPLLEPVPDYI